MQHLFAAGTISAGRITDIMGTVRETPGTPDQWSGE